jgi:hypothetical protein
MPFADPTGNVPVVVDAELQNDKHQDSFIQNSIQTRGPMMNRLVLPRSILQFYTSGVITADDCKSSSNVIWYHGAMTGYSRTGKNGSKPYWQFRGSFGSTWWGLNGLFLIEK